MDDQETARTYTLKLTGGGVTFERQVAEAEALAVLSIVMGGRRLDAPVRDGIRGTESTGLSATPTGLSEGEYLEQSGADKNSERILALGAYLEDELGQQSFTRSDVREAFDRAREPLPGNFARDFALAASNRWLSEVRGSDGDFRLTGTGRKLVEARFVGDTRPSGRSRRRRRSRAGNGDAQAEE